MENKDMFYAHGFEKMTFPRAVYSCFVEKPFDFSGRASRAEFWWFLLFHFFFTLFMMFYIAFIPYPYKYICLAISLFSFIPYISVQVRRLHDIGFSGWWLALLVVPYAPFFFHLLYIMPSYPGYNKWNQNMATKKVTIRDVLFLNSH